jgi:solute carrier family 25 (peroxisomal adenine nucleotide transporter), member 17
LASGLIGVASTNFAYFYWYSFIRQNYVKLLSKRAVQNGLTGKELAQALQITTVMELTLGALAGALAQLMTIPVSVVTTRQQTQVVKSSNTAAPSSVDEIKPTKKPKEKRYSMLDMAKIIIHEEGVFGLWKGLRPALVLTVNPAITYGLFERLKTWLTSTRTNKSLSSVETFALGVFCKTLATVVTYPYIMAKVRLQWKAADYDTNERVRYKDALDVLIRVYQSEGIAGWFNGVNAQVSKAVLSQSLLFVIKDHLTFYTYLLFNAMSSSKTNSAVK